MDSVVCLERQFPAMRKWRCPDRKRPGGRAEAVTRSAADASDTLYVGDIYTISILQPLNVSDDPRKAKAYASAVCNGDRPTPAECENQRTGGQRRRPTLHPHPQGT